MDIITNCEFETSEDFAHKLDSEDPLARFRERFYIPEGTVYMDGNSLGLLSKDSEDSVFRILKEWKTLAIRGWLEARRPWFYLAEVLGAMWRTADLIFSVWSHDISPPRFSLHIKPSVLTIL